MNKSVLKHIAIVICVSLFGSLYCGMVLLVSCDIIGMVWYGMVWYGMVWYGMVWYGMVGMVWYGMVGMAWYGWCGVVWCSVM